MFFTGYWQVCLDKLDNQAGVDSAWEQEKPKAKKMLENGDDWAREQSTATIAHLSA